MKTKMERMEKKNSIQVETRSKQGSNTYANKINFKAISVTTNQKLLYNDKVINYSRRYTISKYLLTQYEDLTT